MLSLGIMTEHANENIHEVFKPNFSCYRFWRRRKSGRMRIEIFCKYAPLEVCWEKFSLGRADDVRTELLKLQITSPWCESRECGVSSRVRDGLWWRWYHVSGSGSQWQSLWTMECPHTSLHTPAPLVTLSPHLTSASWHSLQQSAGLSAAGAAVCLRSVRDYSRAPAWPAGQWSVCSIWSPVANNVRALSS